MTSYVALLRGINVGGKNKIAMADLRSLIGGLGHGDVRTHLNSGNAVFTSDSADADALAAGIEAAITAELGLTIRTLVRSGPEFLAYDLAQHIGPKVRSIRHLVVQSTQRGTQISSPFVKGIVIAPDVDQVLDADPLGDVR